MIDPLCAQILETRRDGNWLCGPLNLNFAAVQAVDHLPRFRDNQKEMRPPVACSHSPGGSAGISQRTERRNSLPAVLKEFNVPTSKEMIVFNSNRRLPTASKMINRRSFLKIAAGAPAVLHGAAPRTNVVFLLADDLGWGDLTSFGCPDIRTPAIDSIGRQGVRFTRAYSNAPECTPTRSALMTGRYQQRVGGLECAIGVGNVGRYDEAEWLQKRGELGLPVSETSIARMFKSHGYDTACFGKWHLGYLDKFSPNAHGFDEYMGVLGGNSDYFTHIEQSGGPVLYRNGQRIDQKGYLTDLFAEEAIGWLKARGARPFFLYVPFTAPHQPYQGPQDGGRPALWNNGSRATYASMVERMDYQVGRIVEQLDRMGAAKNTLLIFMSDNGATPPGRNLPFRGVKTQVWEGGIRSPAMMRWPEAFKPGITTDQVALTMDISATALAACGVKPSRKLDGIDLLPVLRGQRAPFRRTVFWRYKRGQVVRKAVMDGDLKYVNDNGAEAVHDLASDMQEQNNLVVARPADADKLKAKLTAWEREVASPRLRDFRPQQEPAPQ